MKRPIEQWILIASLALLAGMILVMYSPFLYFYVACSFIYCDL